MTPSAVIFDFDGVLADSLDSHLEAWVLATREVFRQEILPPTELSGYSTKTIAHLISKRLGQPTLGNTLAKAKERMLGDLIGPVKLYPGVKETLTSLLDRSVLFAIGSNSSRPFVMATLSAHCLEVATVVTASDVTRHKPAPDIFWRCSNMMNIAPSDRGRILVFEDSPHGIEAAKAASMLPIGVTTAVDAGRLESAGARLTVSSVAAAYDAGWFFQINELT
jgi:HAD superfamily hydrolase (TIGR01509 family)